MLSEEEVKELLRQVKSHKASAKYQGSDETFRVYCKAEKLLKKILEIK